MIKDELRQLLARAVRKAGYELNNKNIVIEKPKNSTYGDYSTNIALTIAQKIKTKAYDVASHLSKQISSKNFNIKVERNGFINFFLANKYLLKIINSEKSLVVFDRKDKNIVIDFSSPNIAKPMHFGHLRSTIIGDSLARILKYVGYDVITDNHLGDWGTQFGKLLYAYKKWGDKDKKITIDRMLKLYVKYHVEEKNNPEITEFARDEFRKLEKGNTESLKLWKDFRKNSLEDFDKIYKILNIEFDETLGESFYKDRANVLIDKILNLKIAKKDQEALIIPMEEDEVPLLVQKKDGTTLYATRDLAAIEYRIEKFRADKILYVIGNEQQLYVKQLEKAVKKLSLDQVELVHVGFGLVKLGNEKMSTRAGKVVYLKELIDKGIDKAYEILEAKNTNLYTKEINQIAKVVGIGAIKYNDLSQNRVKDINFSFDKMLDFKGNSAPYIQYTYARIRSLLRKSRIKSFDSIKNVEFEKIEKNILLRLLDFDNIIVLAADRFMPSYVATYLYELTNDYNNMYQKLPILDSEDEHKYMRLKISKLVADKIKQGLELLGIEVVERM